MRSGLRTFFVFCALASGCLLHAPAVADEASHYIKVLQEKNIQPTAKGLRAYFDELHPTAEQKKRIATLIQQLGSIDSFSDREEAMKKLLTMPMLPSQALITATRGSDPEIRWRARRVLAAGGDESRKTLYAAFRTVQQKEISGLVKELLAAIPLCDQQHLETAAAAALVATAERGDADEIRRAIAGENETVKLAAIAALGAALKKESSPDLVPLLKDKDEQVSLAAARAMANFGDHRALSALTRLMGSTDVKVRAQASMMLRALTGERFDFAAYDKPDKRLAAVKRWNDWIEADGQAAKLQYPLKLWNVGSHLNGNLLLSCGYRNRVVEYDPSGKEVWSFSVNNAWSAEKLPSGNVLIATYSGGRVIEVDLEGKVVWEYRCPSPLDAKPLANGNVLITTYTMPGQILEVTREKEVVWKHQVQGYGAGVQRLENGNTLIAAWGTPIVEVNPDGETVWQYNLTTSWSCQMLPSGNVLLCDRNQNKVVEVNRAKEIVWEFTENQPVDAFRLPNGNTLISTDQRYVEVTPDKKILWTRNECNRGRARK